MSFSTLFFFLLLYLHLSRYCVSDLVHLCCTFYIFWVNGFLDIPIHIHKCVHKFKKCLKIILVQGEIEYWGFSSVFRSEDCKLSNNNNNKMFSRECPFALCTMIAWSNYQESILDGIDWKDKTYSEKAKRHKLITKKQKTKREK